MSAPTMGLAFFVLVAGLAAQEPAAQSGPRIAITGGKVVTVTGPTIAGGVVLVRDGKIEKVGSAEDVEVPKGYRVIDATGKTVTPGFIELHNHTGASDLHDIVYQVNPELRVLDNLELNTPQMKVAVAGGVTCLLVIPGSGTNMGGFGVIRKTWGSTPKEVLVRFPGALKIAQAGNPERGSGDLGSSRLGMNWLIRNVLAEGKAYHEAWTRYEKGETKQPPEKNLRYEYLRGLFRRDYPVAVHTQGMSLVQMTMRILRDEMGLDVVIDHGTFDGYINAPALQARKVPVAAGPRGYYFDRKQGRFLGVPASWYWLGVDEDSLGVNTDAPVIPQEELVYQGSMAVRLGLPERVALKGLTINAARMLKIDRRVGSLEAGKDADISIWTGDPLDPRHRTQVVLVNGKVAYDAARDGIRF